MTEEGFEFIERTLQEGKFVPYATIGSLTPELAEAHGLGALEGFLGENEASATDPNRDAIDELPRNEKEAWIDAFIDCRADIRSRINGPWVKQVDALIPVYQDMVDRLIADPRNQAVQRSWSECFAEGGFGAYETLDDLVIARQDIAFELDRFDTAAVEGVRAQEYELAAAAAKCAEPLREQWQAIWDEYEADFLAANEIPAIPTCQVDAPGSSCP